MMNPRHPRTRRTAAALLAVGVLALAACGESDETSETDRTASDADTSPDDGIQLLAAGQGETIQLPVEYAVGRKATASVDMNADISVDAAGQNVDAGFGFTMGITQEVVAVSDDTATMELSLDSIEVTDAPAGVEDQLASTFDGMVGKVLVAEYDDSGSLVGEITVKDGGELPAEMASSFNQTNTQIKYPAEPVGVGAEWVGLTTVESNGLDLEVETTYELTKITLKEYVVTVTQDTPVDESVDGVDLDGTLSGSGEARVSRSNPAAMDMTYTQDADFEISGDGQSGDMSMKIDMTMKSR